MDSPRKYVPEYEAPETRLPIQHPEYRYPSSRNIYYAKVRTLQGRIFTDNDCESKKGKWRTQFPDKKSDQRPLHVEVGCNGGHVILEWAARNPQNAYIGVDWKFKQIHRGTEKALKRKLDNLIFFRGNSERLQYMFGPGEIDFLYLFFPDPWEKKSQHKNRFFTAERLRQVALLMNKGGTFHIKTDHVEYFDWMLKAVSEVNELWELRESTRDLHASRVDAEKLTMPDVTLFERIFIKNGTPINQMKLVRR